MDFFLAASGFQIDALYIHTCCCGKLSRQGRCRTGDSSAYPLVSPSHLPFIEFQFRVGSYAPPVPVFPSNPLYQFNLFLLSSNLYPEPNRLRGTQNPYFPLCSCPSQFQEFPASCKIPESVNPVRIYFIRLDHLNVSLHS